MKKNSPENDLTFKIITLGNPGVGKTSIIQRYLGNTFDDNSMSTVGLQFSCKKVKLNNNESIILKLIDTGGQERYRSLSKSYFRNTDGVLFVFSLNNSESFKEITEWIQMFNENNNGKDNIPRYLVGNKCDLQKEIEQEKIDAIANNYNLKYYETSAKENVEIDKLFEDISIILYQGSNSNKNTEQKKIQINSQLQEEKKKKNSCCHISNEIEDQSM